MTVAPPPPSGNPLPGGAPVTAPPPAWAPAPVWYGHAGPPPRPRRPAPWRIVPPPVRWGLPDAGVMLAVLPVVIVLGLVAIEFVPPDYWLVVALGVPVIGYGATIGGLAVISRWRGLGSFARDFGLGFRWIDVPIGLGIGIVAKLGGVFFGVLVTVLVGEPPKSGNFELSDDPIDIWINGLLLGVIVAPFAEELLMRGLVLRSVRWAVLRGRRRERPQPAPDAVQRWAIALAILVSTVLFAALHLWQAPDDVALFWVLALGTGFAGLLHAGIVILTGRLGAAIIAHVFFNGSSWLLQLLLF